MPTALPKHPALVVRDVLVDNWTPANTASYDPGITDPTDANYLAMSRGWYSVGGGHDPFIALTNFGEGVIGGGETDISVIMGDGSGVAQARSGTGRITVFAESESDYDGETAADVVDLIRKEVERIPFEDATQGGPQLAYLGTTFDGATTDTDPTPPVEIQTVSVTYGWVRS